MKKGGFSLIEVVVSTLILSIVIPGALCLTITANKQVNETKHRFQMANQAQRVLEKLRYYVSADPDDPLNAGDALAIGTGLSPDLIGLGITPDISDVGSPGWSYDVTEVADSGCKRVTVTVTWEEL